MQQAGERAVPQSAWASAEMAEAAVAIQVNPWGNRFGIGLHFWVVPRDKLAGVAVTPTSSYYDLEEMHDGSQTPYRYVCRGTRPINDGQPGETVAWGCGEGFENPRDLARHLERPDGCAKGFARTKHMLFARLPSGEVPATQIDQDQGHNDGHNDGHNEVDGGGGGEGRGDDDYDDGSDDYDDDDINMPALFQEPEGPSDTPMPAPVGLTILDGFLSRLPSNWAPQERHLYGIVHKPRSQSLTGWRWHLGGPDAVAALRTCNVEKLVETALAALPEVRDQLPLQAHCFEAESVAFHRGGDEADYRRRLSHLAQRLNLQRRVRLLRARHRRPPGEREHLRAGAFVPTAPAFWLAWRKAWAGESAAVRDALERQIRLHVSLVRVADGLAHYATSDDEFEAFVRGVAGFKLWAST